MIQSEAATQVRLKDAYATKFVKMRSHIINHLRGDDQFKGF